MQADTVFARPRGSFELPVNPPGVSPLSEPLAVVAYSCAWQPYVIGALKQLLLQATWNVATPDELNAVQQQAVTLINLFINSGCFGYQTDACKPQSLGVEGGDDNLIRQSPDNPCLLQTSIDGVNWCTFADISKCIPPSPQPGAGSPLPPAGGGQQCYNAQMLASEKWLLPTQVNTGDVLVVSNETGAATDGTASWFCPNGRSFFLGTCTGFTTLNGADPMPTKPHMELIAKINGVYYEMVDATLTIPSGVVNANVEFQVNDSTLSDNSGDYAFKVCLTNNQTVQWCRVFDFISGDGGWDGVAHGGAAVPTWVAGTGWHQPDYTAAAGVSHFNVIHRAFGATLALTAIEVDYKISGASGTGTTEGVACFDDDNGSGGIFFISQPDGNGNYISTPTFSISKNAIWIRGQVDSTNPSTVCHCAIDITKVKLYGTGSPPTIGSPC